MARIYYTKSKRQKAIDQIFEDMRRLRESLPEKLLNRVGTLLTEQMQENGEEERVDRQKNFRTVSKFLQITPENPSLKKELQKFLAEQR